jgi:hypothetical protein
MVKDATREQFKEDLVYLRERVKLTHPLYLSLLDNFVIKDIIEWAWLRGYRRGMREGRDFLGEIKNP